MLIIGYECQGTRPLDTRPLDTKDDRRASIDSAYQTCSFEQPVTVAAMAEYLGVSERCVRDRLKECRDDYWFKAGCVGRIERPENTEN